jgi:PadR family transcriptional regulator PadR
MEGEMNNNGFLKGNTKMLVLAIIDTGSKYGYEIIKELESKSFGSFELKEGTLYPILHELEREEFILSSEYKMENNRVRKYYKITKKGKAYLYNMKKDWADYVSKVNVILGKSI